MAFVLRGAKGENSVMHSMEGPIFNDGYNASRDSRSVLHGKLGPVPGFSGGQSILLHQPFHSFYLLTSLQSKECKGWYEGKKSAKGCKGCEGWREGAKGGEKVKSVQGAKRCKG